MSIQISFGSRIRKSPFFDKTVEAGVKSFTIYNHMYMPTGYGDPEGEYDRLINGVAMWDVAVERQVALKGKNARELARILTTRKIEALEYGMGRYVPICDHRGVMHNDPILLQVADDEYWFSIADRELVLFARAIAWERGFEVDVWEPDVSPLAIQGPKAFDVGESIFGSWIRELRHFQFCETDLNGIPILVQRSGWSHQGGFELYLRDGSRGSELWDIVAEAGKPFDIGPGNPNSIERVESGLISMGSDTDDETTPYEMGLGKFVNLDRDVDFIGKEALRELADQKPKRRYRGFFIDGDRLQSGSTHAWPVLDDDGAKVGFISSAVWSPRLKRNIGIGLISTDTVDFGKPAKTISESGVRDVSTCDLPFKIENV